MRIKNIAEKYFSYNTINIFFIIVAIYALAITIELNFVFTDDFYYESLSNSNNKEKVADFITKDRDSEWINYPMILVVVLFPAILIALALYLGSVLKGFKLKYKDYFIIALKAQIIFALNYLLGIILKWQGLIDRKFYNINNSYDYQSLLVFFKNKNIPEELIYLLQNINITEFVHILFLSLGISYALKTKYIKAIGFVTLFYGIALLIWIIFTVFLQILF